MLKEGIPFVKVGKAAISLSNDSKFSASQKKLALKTLKDSKNKKFLHY